MVTGIPHGPLAGAGGPGQPGDTPGPASASGLTRLAIELIIGAIMGGALPAALITVPGLLAAVAR
jgi:hypothetical protein